MLPGGTNSNQSLSISRRGRGLILEQEWGHLTPTPGKPAQSGGVLESRGLLPVVRVSLGHGAPRLQGEVTALQVPPLGRRLLCRKLRAEGEGLWLRGTAWLGTPLLALLRDPRALCFSVLLWKAGALVAPPALRRRCSQVQGDRGPGKPGLDGGGRWRPGARAGPADQASSGSPCLTVGSTPREEGAPKPLSASAWATTTLFLPPQQPQLGGLRGEAATGCREDVGCGAGCYVRGGFKLVHPLPCPNFSIVPLPVPGSPRPTLVIFGSRPPPEVSTCSRSDTTLGPSGRTTA